jgi:hypothetical protein
VVTLTGALAGETPSASLATTVKLYWVVGFNPVTAKVGVVLVPTGVVTPL